MNHFDVFKKKIILVFTENISQNKLGYSLYNPNISANIYIDQINENTWLTVVEKILVVHNIQRVIVPDILAINSCLLKLCYLIKTKYQNILIFRLSFSKFDIYKGISIIELYSVQKLLAKTLDTVKPK